MHTPREVIGRMRARFPGAAGRAAVTGCALAVLAVWLGFWLAEHRGWLMAAAEPSGRRKALEVLVRTCVWWSAMATALVAAGLSLTAWVSAARGRGGWVGEKKPQPLVAGGVARWKWFFPLLACVLVIAGGMRTARLGFSNYNDENHSYSRHVAGIWQNFGEEGARFRQPHWVETAFGNHTGNNGFLQSILARVCHDWWVEREGVAQGAVVEWPSRLPALAGGLFSIFAVAMTLRRAGYPALGLVAALVLALHPWHLRYSSEARAYGLMMAGLAGSVWFLMAAMRTGRWRDWLAHAFFLMLALWAQAGALFFILGMQGGLVIWAGGRALRRTDLRPALVSHGTRWAVAGLAAALAASFALAPGMVQLADALANHPAMETKVAPGWWRDTLALLATGARWVPAGPENALSPAAGESVLTIMGYAAFWVLVLAGVWRWWRDGATRVIAVVIVGGMGGLLVFYFRSAATGNVLMWWYAVPALPLLALAVAGAFRGGRRLMIAASLLGLVMIAGWMPVLAVYLQHGKADPRSLTRLARGGDFPDFERAPVTLTLWSDGGTYDPLMVWLDDMAFLDRKIEEAAERGVPLFILTAHEGKARASHPEVMRRLAESGEFRLDRVAWGLEDDTFTNRLYRYEGSAEGDSGGGD